MTVRRRSGLEREAAEITSERRQLLNLAYRLLGSLTDAEDVLQETSARWYALSPQQRAAIESPGAWLTRVAGRICLDVLGSARVRRERYVGEWLPEPLPDQGADPADQVTLDESVTMAFLVVLEQLTPAERVSFVLHDVFRYPFAEVAAVVGRSPAACRQLATSARRRIRAAQRDETPAARRAEVVKDFQRAWEAKDIKALVALLDPAAVMVADGGGQVSTVLRPVVGGEQIARYLVGIGRLAPELAVLARTVSNRPGLVATHDGVTVTVAAFEVVDDRITRIWAVRNPEKLASWSARGRS
ncbi:RNA polymerase sigma factor SigJ [Lentzea sp. NPDC004789]